MYRKSLLIILAVLSFVSCRTDRTVSLAGEWKFALDTAGVGVSEGWFGQELPDRIEFPGSCEERGFGFPAQEPTEGRLTRVIHYEGKAWYQKDVEIPASWKGLRTELFLERCHWETTLWVDGEPAGSRNSLSAPHVYDLGVLSPGKHTLTVLVDNTYKLPIGTWAHAITEDTQSNWNGMIGRLELRATPQVWIENVQVHPDALLVQVGNITGAPKDVTIRGELFEIPSGGSQVRVAFTPESGEWDEFSPDIKRLSLKMESDAGKDCFEVGYANRDITIGGKQVVVNGHPILFRGPVDECVYPLTGYPPMDKASWMRVLGICRDHGFNYMRFHSWCPPEAAFEAADELGIYFQVELPFWSMDAPEFGTDPERDRFLSEELRTILDTYGNHPSFAIMAMGNESSGPLLKLVREGKARDPRHLYRAENGGGMDNGDLIETGMRGIAGPRTDWDRWSNSGWIAGVSIEDENRRTGSDLPTLGHEIGQWEMYPDFDEIDKYTGTLRAYNYEGYRKSLQEHGMMDQAKDFARASGKFSVLLYKEDIEASMRTWPFAGFQILEARDYPGQGTAIVGWLDAFWDSKGLITPEEFRQFCGPTVLLFQTARRVYTAGDTLEGFAEIAHYGKEVMDISPKWELLDSDGVLLSQGEFPPAAVPAGKVTNLSHISIPMEKAWAGKLTLVLKSGELRNQWDIWAFPEKEGKVPDNVLIAHSYDAATRAALARGERVVLFSDPDSGIFPVEPAFFGGDDVRLFEVDKEHHAVEGSFMPTFWNMRLFNQTGTLGLLIQTDHPALKEFPTEEHSDWQWADLLGRFSAAQSFRTAGAPSEYCDEMERIWGDVRGRSKAIVLNDAPEGYKPIVQAIDNFERNYRLGVIFETKVGEGRLLVCAMDLDTDAAQRPAARCLKQSLLDYAAGDEFNPQYSLDPRMLETVL